MSEESENQDETAQNQQYERDYPPLQAKEAGKTEKWGPTQAPRASARNAGDTRTVLQKAPQLKETQDTAVLKGHGMKPNPFSLFNNPAFLTVSSKIGIDVESDVVDKDSISAFNSLISYRTIGSASDFTTPVRCSSKGGIDHNSSLDSEGLWNLVCKNKRGKHPRTRLLS
jgi:hypothetical protein